MKRQRTMLPGDLYGKKNVQAKEVCSPLTKVLTRL